MDIEYLRTSRNSYMIVKNADYEFENYELQMILHNNIPSLLEFQVIMGDGAAEYWYDVTGMQSLEKQFSFLALGVKQLRFFLRNLIRVKNAMEEYLLNDRNLSFSPSMIFYDRFTKTIRFCYIPGLAEHCACDIRGLFEELLQHLDHTDPEAVRLGYDMYERCAQAEFLVEDCIECLTNRDDENEVWLPGQQPLQNDGDFEKGNEIEGNEPFDERPVLEPIPERCLVREEKTGKFWKKKRRPKRRAQIDYSEILDEEQHKFYAAEEIRDNSETEIFYAEDQKVRWKLIYKGDGDEPDFALTNFPYWVGTDREKVQGVLAARTVSRVHAKFLLEDDQIYLEDFNSTNGTYVNHRMIPMNTPIALQNGDRIFFATEEYVLSCRGMPRESFCETH